MIPGIYDCFKHWSNQGTVWIYSDPHFNDPEQRKMCSKWLDDEEQVKMINAKVGRKDTLIILGDVGDIEYVKKLRGYKVLIAGNHDAGLSNYKRQVYAKQFDADKIDKWEALFAMRKLYPDCKYTIKRGHQMKFPFEYWEAFADNQLFDEVYGGALFIGEKIVLSHEPFDIKFALNIHGHDHAGKKNDKYHLNVCSNVIGYTPINFNKLIKSGPTAHIESIHRVTIDKATKRKKERNR